MSSGPVTATVVGDMRPKYTLLGNTVVRKAGPAGGHIIRQGGGLLSHSCSVAHSAPLLVCFAEHRRPDGDQLRSRARPPLPRRQGRPQESGAQQHQAIALGASSEKPATAARTIPAGRLRLFHLLRPVLAVSFRLLQAPHVRLVSAGVLPIKGAPEPLECFFLDTEGDAPEALLGATGANGWTAAHI